jgi:hypothetical protein
LANAVILVKSAEQVKLTCCTKGRWIVKDRQEGTDLLSAAERQVPRADGLTDEEFEQLTEELFDTEFQVPDLPDHALTREGLYEDHP